MTSAKSKKERDYNPESEQAVVGSILLSGTEALESALAAGLDFQHFFDERYRLVFKAGLNLATKGKPIDMVTVRGELAEIDADGKVDAVFLANATSGIPEALNIKAYAERVLADYWQRRRRQAVENAHIALESGNGGFDDAFENILQTGVECRQTAKTEHNFEQIAEDRYRLAIPEAGISFEIDRLRREHNELIGELAVACKLPGVSAYDGSLSIADFNVSSARARSERASLLSKRANVNGLDWSGYLEEFVQRVLAAERNGQPAVDLRKVEKPEADDGLLIEGIRLPRRHPAILFGDGGAAKSYLGLYLAGDLAQQGFSVALFDWELAADDHRDRLERLFGLQMPRILYARCERPLIYEMDRLRRIVRDEQIDFAVYDSIAFACDGAPESAEIAGKYFRAARQIGVGSLHIAHITKSEGGDLKPFGSVFWHNGARSTYFVKLSEESNEGDTLHIGLFNRKSNLGRLQRPTGFAIQFDPNRTWFTHEDPADTPDLAEKLTIRQRMIRLLSKGEMPLKDLADSLDSQQETVSRTVRRYKGIFTVLDGGKVALLQRGK